MGGKREGELEREKEKEGEKERKGGWEWQNVRERDVNHSVTQQVHQALDFILAHIAEFNSDLSTSTILGRLFADAVELSIRTDTQSGSNVTSPHYVNS